MKSQRRYPDKLMPLIDAIRILPIVPSEPIRVLFACALLSAFLLVATTASGQEDFSFRSAAEKLSITRLFKSKSESSSASANKPNRHPIQPTPLKVVDRATAKQIAGLPPSATDPRYAVVDPTADNDSYALAAANFQSEREVHSIDNVSYQQPLPHPPKVYSTPSMSGQQYTTPPDGNYKTYPPEAYRYSDSYYHGNRDQNNYAPQYRPNHPPAVFAPAGPLNPVNGNDLRGNENRYLQQQPVPQPRLAPQQPFLDERPTSAEQKNWDAPPLKYESVMDDGFETLPPPANQSLPRGQQRSPPPRTDVSTGLPAGAPDGYHSNVGNQFPLENQASLPANGYDAGAGRGYLQYGSALQGRRLHANPQTATERALEIQAENDRLKETITRTQLELGNRNQELENARSMYRQKEEELAASLTKVNELNSQLLRLTSELKVAEQDKINIQKRSAEQLKAIESTLDGVLMNSITRNSEPE